MQAAASSASWTASSAAEKSLKRGFSPRREPAAPARAASSHDGVHDNRLALSEASRSVQIHGRRAITSRTSIGMSTGRRPFRAPPTRGRELIGTFPALDSRSSNRPETPSPRRKDHRLPRGRRTYRREPPRWSGPATPSAPTSSPASASSFPKALHEVNVRLDVLRWPCANAGVLPSAPRGMHHQHVLHVLLLSILPAFAMREGGLSWVSRSAGEFSTSRGQSPGRL